MGEPERAVAAYAEENSRRGSLIEKHLDFIGELSPFLEIGANAGHTSYLLANHFTADGFALDLSADALRHGACLRQRWNLARAPVLIAGDALRLPFRNGSLRSVLAFQMLSQFMDIDSVLREVARVLAPGGVFFCAEEPIRRLLSLRLYRCPYPDRMKPWERRLYQWGVLDYLVKDVVGARQEASFGIRQNHRTGLRRWKQMLGRHFAEQRCDVFVRDQGWANQAVRRMVARAGSGGGSERAAALLGGTLAACARKAGRLAQPVTFSADEFESVLACPDCGHSLRRPARDRLACAGCGFAVGSEGGVYTLMPSAEKAELYPGSRPDTLDFSRPGHELGLVDGFYELEGENDNNFRWMGPRAAAILRKMRPGAPRLRIRGFAHELAFSEQRRVTLEIRANARRVGRWKLDRPGLFVLEKNLPEAPEYLVEILASPVWRAPGEDRLFTVNLSAIRLLPREG